MSGNFQGLAMGVAGILGGALVLIVGLNMSDIVISSINETGSRVGCYSGEGDIPIDNARYAGTAATNAAYSGAGETLPTSGEVEDASAIIGRQCVENGVATFTKANTGGVTATFDGGAPTNPRKHGTIRYQLEVYGATGLNNIFSLLYFIVLVMIALGMVGGGTMIARNSIQNMSG